MPNLARYTFDACIKGTQEMKLNSWSDADIQWGGMAVTKTEGVLVTDLQNNHTFIVDCSECENDEDIIQTTKEAIEDYESRIARAAGRKSSLFLVFD